MSKPLNPGRKPVALAPSRIRREPLRAEAKVEPRSREQELWGGVAGVVAIAVAIALLAVGVAAATISGAGEDSAPAQRFSHCYQGLEGDCVIDGNSVRIGAETVEIAADVPAIRGAQCAVEARRGVDAAVKLRELLNRGPVQIGPPVAYPEGQTFRSIEIGGRDVATAMIAAGVAREPGGGERGWCRKSES